jgi:hypothetical protein
MNRGHSTTTGTQLQLFADTTGVCESPSTRTFANTTFPFGNNLWERGHPARMRARRR